VQECIERLALVAAAVLVGRRHLDGAQHLARVRAVVAVVEERNVPAGVQRVEEALERAGALGKD
jgi:hypothetical protein